MAEKAQKRNVVVRSEELSAAAAVENQYLGDDLEDLRLPEP